MKILWRIIVLSLAILLLASLVTRAVITRMAADDVYKVECLDLGGFVSEGKCVRSVGP